MRILLLSIFICFAFAVAAQHAADTIEAYYPGGQGAWTRHLIKNLGIIPLDSSAEYSSVALVFRVSADGTLSNVQMLSGDTSLLTNFTELILRSGRWVPAKVNERVVPSTKSLFINYCMRGD